MLRTFLRVFLLLGAFFSGPAIPLAAQSGGPSGAYVMKWPVTGRATSRVGPRWGRFHAGRDIACSYVPVRAAYDGQVTRLGNDPRGYGYYVDVTHAAGYMTRYAHLSKFVARVGQKVSRSQQIAVSGNTGNSTGPHLHFEIRRYGAVQKPYWDAAIPLTTHRHTEFIPVTFPGLGGGSQTGRLRGVVYDASRGTSVRIAGATVTLADGRFVTSSSNGYFEFTLPAGMHRYAGTAAGFGSLAMSRVVPAGGEIWGSLGLRPVRAPRLAVNPAPAVGSSLGLAVTADPGSPVGLLVSARPNVPPVSLGVLGDLWPHARGAVGISLGTVPPGGVLRPALRAPSGARGVIAHVQAIARRGGRYAVSNGAALRVR